MKKTDGPDMRPTRENILDKILKDEPANRALNKLVKEKADADQVIFLLWKVATSHKERKPLILAPRRRKLDKLRKKTLDLARQIELANLYSGLSRELFHLKADPRIPFCHLMELPQMLREYARILELVRSKSMRPENRPIERDEIIDFLLHIVRERTGTSHYSEVALLLNAVDRARAYDATDLAIRAHREREFFKKPLNQAGDSGSDF